MRRALSLAVIAASGLTTAGAAQAQSAAAPGQAAGLRYLSWNGRGPVASPVAAAPDVPRSDLRRPNRVIPRGGFASAAPVTTAPSTPAPSHAPSAAPRAAPIPSVATAPPPPVHVEAPRPAMPASAPVVSPVQPDYLRGAGQAVPASVLTPPAMEQPPVYNETAADPMAPRRDAPIFRMQQPAQPPAEPPPPAGPQATDSQPRRMAETTVANERPPVQGARYYSVHRQNGRQPDVLTMPDPTYIDAMAVTLAETPASQDLAQPEQGPTLIRDRNGKTRALPAASTGDHQ